MTSSFGPSAVQFNMEKVIGLALARLNEITAGFETNSSFDTPTLRRITANNRVVEVVSLGTETRYGIQLDQDKIAENSAPGILVAIQGGRVERHNMHKVSLVRGPRDQIQVKPGW